MSVVPGSTPGPQPSHTTSLGTMATTEVIHLNRLAAISTNSAPFDVPTNATREASTSGRALSHSNAVLSRSTGMSANAAGSSGISRSPAPGE
jgi:hypothetical protein